MNESTPVTSLLAVVAPVAAYDEPPAPIKEPCPETWLRSPAPTNASSPEAMFRAPLDWIVARH